MNKELWFEKAREAGIDGLEITQSINQSRNMEWFDEKQDSFVTSRMVYTSIRALIGDKIVSISLEKVDDDMADDVLKELKEQAQFVSETEKDILMPVIETEEVKSDRKWTRPSMSEVQDFLASVEKKLKEADPRISMVNGVEWSDTISGKSLQNSLGVDVNDDSEAQIFGASITMTENGELRDGYKYEVVENIADFDQDAFVKKLVDEVAGTLNASSMKSRTCPVIFEADAMTTLFGCFVRAFYGSSIAKGISPLTGKLHEKIFSDKITVIDDPRNLSALQIANYDDEGHPTSTKVVVDKGVFETILHNSRSALKMNAESTGNGFKSGGGATDVSHMNMYIVPGKDSLKELEEKMNDGVVITDLAGMHAGVDFVSGNFSLQARGYLVKNGKKERPLTLITVAGNFFDLMSSVEAVGSDLDWSYKGLVCPSILFKSAAIGGNEQ